MKLSNVLSNVFSIDIDHVSIAIDIVTVLSPSSTIGPIVEFRLPVDKFALILLFLCCVQLHQLYFKVSEHR